MPDLAYALGIIASRNQTLLCSKCYGDRMVLAGSRPGPDHSELRTFQCPECGHVHKVAVEDPLDSVGSTGWTDNDLGPAH
ncbi:hypothetical protein ACO2JO_08110 [Leptospira interrogans]